MEGNSWCVRVLVLGSRGLSLAQKHLLDGACATGSHYIVGELWSIKTCHMWDDIRVLGHLEQVDPKISSGPRVWVAD